MVKGCPICKGGEREGPRSFLIGQFLLSSGSPQAVHSRSPAKGAESNWRVSATSRGQGAPAAPADGSPSGARVSVAPPAAPSAGRLFQISSRTLLIKFVEGHPLLLVQNGYNVRNYIPSGQFCFEVLPGSPERHQVRRAPQVLGDLDVLAQRLLRRGPRNRGRQQYRRPSGRVQRREGEN